MKNSGPATLDRDYIQLRKYESRPGWVMTLVAQILCQAIKDAQRKDRQMISAENKIDAEAWLASDEDLYLFDFINICRLFDVDHRLMRAKIANGVKLPNLYPKTREEEN